MEKGAYMDAAIVPAVRPPPFLFLYTKSLKVVSRGYIFVAENIEKISLFRGQLG